MYRPVQTIAPATTPVSVAEIKTHCRLDDSDSASDGVLAAYLNAAVSHLDGWTGILGLCLVEQTWRQDFDRFARCLRLPLAPVISITSVTYLDPSGESQTVDAESYEVLTDDLGPYVRFVETYSFPAVKAWGPAVSVTYKAGYATVGSVSTVPDAIKHAIMLLVSHWQENREGSVIGVSAVKLPMGVDRLIEPFRRNRF